MTKIHASGTSTNYFLAERATIFARISVTSRNREQSIRQATELHNWVAARAAQLRSNGDATWHAAEPIKTWAHRSYPEGSNKNAVTMHTTSSRVQVKLSNLEIVSALVEEFSQAGAETSVTWALTEASRRAHERDARMAAVNEAREIANDYAEALGERVQRVVSISDGNSAGIAYAGAVPRFAAMKGADAAPPAEVTRAEITVAATVAGVFESR